MHLINFIKLKRCQDCFSELENLDDSAFFSYEFLLSYP